MTDIAIEHGPVEIVSCPIQNGDVPVRYASLPEGYFWLDDVLFFLQMNQLHEESVYEFLQLTFLLCSSWTSRIPMKFLDKLQEKHEEEEHGLLFIMFIHFLSLFHNSWGCEPLEKMHSSSKNSPHASLLEVYTPVRYWVHSVCMQIHWNRHSPIN